MGQRIAKRDKYYQLSRYRQNERGHRLTERNIDILQRHLDKEHNRPHKEVRRVLLHNSRNGLARREQARVYLRHGERNRPYGHGKNKRDYGYAAYAAALVKADKRLHSVPKSVKRQRDKLKRAEHNRQSRGIVLVAARGAVEVDVEHDLNRTFGYCHDKRRKAE